MSTHGAPSNEGLLQLAKRIPKGTWDTHMHVVDPRQFPLAKDAKYQPSPHTIDDARKFLSQLGISKMVIVQPSIYGNDNSCTLEGLRQLGPSNGRAVIQFDPETTSNEQLQKWHSLGVRGVRLNFKSVGAKRDETTLKSSLQKYAEAVRGLGWVVELYIAMEDLPLLSSAVRDLRSVKLCIDHSAHPSPGSLSSHTSVSDLPGHSSLLELLQRDDVWVKVSAAYRLDSDPNHPLVKMLMKEIIATRPDRCVFATDWPHTRYEGLDIAPYLNVLFDLCEEMQIPLQQILVDNAEELFDAHGP